MQTRNLKICRNRNSLREREREREREEFMSNNLSEYVGCLNWVVTNAYLF